ncbi:MAG: helix-turn-helix domain-containing protein [Spirochaetota bacterium]
MADEETLVFNADGSDLSSLPEIMMFGDARHRSAEQQLGPHRNPGVEICLCRSGIYRWVVEGTDVEIKPGELSITRPWQLHSGQDNVLGPGRLCWIIVEAGGADRLESPALEALLGEEAAWVSDTVSSSAHSFIGSIAEAPALFDLIAGELTGRQPGRVASIRAAVARLLVVVARRLMELGENDYKPFDPIPQSVLAVLSEVARAPEGEWTSAGMADRAGLGATAFTEWCRRATGRSPRWYVLERRLRSARDLLVESEWTVTEIANETGFASSQHFSASFRKLFGETPTAYRRRVVAVEPPPDPRGSA